MDGSTFETAAMTDLAAPTATDADKARVAVLIAAWRAAATIGRAVETALAQPETAEVIVVDDASGDEGATVAAAQAADDGTGRLRIAVQPRNAGPAAARNEAIRLSTAPWLCIVDSDDFMEPGRLGRLLAVAESQDFIADDILQEIAGEGPATRRPMWFDGPSDGLDMSLAFFVDANISRAGRSRRELGFIKPLMRRAFLDRHRLRYDETMRLGEDYDLYVRALAAGARFRLTPAMGYVAVMRADSLSAVHGRADLAAFAAADTRLLAGSQLSAVDEKLIRAHRKSIERRIAWIDFMDAVKAKRPFPALRILLNDPLQAPKHLGQFAYVSVRKLWRVLKR